MILQVHSLPEVSRLHPSTAELSQARHSRMLSQAMVRGFGRVTDSPSSCMASSSRLRFCAPSVLVSCGLADLGGFCCVWMSQTERGASG